MTDKRPWTVTAGCAMSVAIFVSDVVSALCDADVIEMPGLLAFVFGLSIIPLAFTIAAFFRRNGGRIGLTVMTALGVLAVPFLIRAGAEMAGPMDVETLLYAIANIAVVLLLFMPASNEWYRSRFAA